MYDKKIKYFTVVEFLSGIHDVIYHVIYSDVVLFECGAVLCTAFRGQCEPLSEEDETFVFLFSSCFYFTVYRTE